AGAQVRCSLADRFLLRIAEVVGPQAKVVVVIASGSRTTERDRTAWLAIQKTYRLEVIARYDRFTFERCNPHTTVVRLAPHRGNQKSRCVYFSKGSSGMGLVRGWVQMYSRHTRCGKVWLPLVHTTDLQKGTGLLSGKRERAPS